MERTEGKTRFAILKDRARIAPGIRHRCRQRTKRSRAKPDRYSLRVPPIPRRPQGLAARRGASLGLMLTLKYGVTLRAEGFTQQKGQLLLDIEHPDI
jgi:hypothetical protein